MNKKFGVSSEDISETVAKIKASNSHIVKKVEESTIFVAQTKDNYPSVLELLPSGNIMEIGSRFLGEWNNIEDFLY